MPKPQYAILREQKRSDMGQVSRSDAHNNRSRFCGSSDSSKPAPTLLYGSASLSKTVKSKIPHARRSNAVIAVECLCSASPEFFARATSEQYGLWVKASVDWLKEVHGDNLCQVYLHEDESTPHLHAYWVPMKDGKLNYRAIQGSPKDLVLKQSSYARAMATLGLVRGQPNAARRNVHSSKVVDELRDSKIRLSRASRAAVGLFGHVHTLEGIDALKALVSALGSTRASPTPHGPLTLGQLGGSDNAAKDSPIACPAGASLSS